ncbi:MAG: histidinol dehydrogenase [Clostridia bacterium]|nr:histidinol dehydrogenase [Clostridia bacterium]
MINIGIYDLAASKERLAAMKSRAGELNADINVAVAGVLEDVRKRGDAALKEYTRRFDGVDVVNFELDKRELEKAKAAADPKFVAALEKAAERIAAFHRRQLSKSWSYTEENGTKLGQISRGLSRVGVYVPGGTAAYPSSVLMNIIPAKVAGVEEIIVCTPPFRDHASKNSILTAAAIAGADRVITAGGAQAVAALAYGTESIPAVDKITGPGNAYVAAAKRMVYGIVDIDMVAGPSEILLIADETADPKFAAADLLSQAEHDRLASSIMVTTSLSLAEKTAAELAAMAEKLPRRDIVADSITQFGAIIVCPKIDDAIDLANSIAPEHLEIMTADPEAVLAKIKNAGSVFLGSMSPEPLGDYMAGPNHVLPTGGTARFYSPLSVESFTKRQSFIYASEKLLKELADDVVLLAQTEGLEAHANSVRVRKEVI